MANISFQDETAEYNRKQNTYCRKDEKQKSIMVVMRCDVIEIVSYIMSQLLDNNGR
jgi:hypothetical protein